MVLKTKVHGQTDPCFCCGGTSFLTKSTLLFSYGPALQAPENVHVYSPKHRQQAFCDVEPQFKDTFQASNLNKGVLEDEVDESSRSSFNSSCDVSRSVKTTYIQEKVFVSAKIMSVVEVDGSEDSCSWLSDIGFGYDCMKVSGVKDIPEAY
ncbi:hypothetical protein V6N12_044237 [Hibiscus sabdariffa]|uniref:Uncharacterized protein n=1 Tax=Hibiscus sabdariffa TaxID=183260 RepID=A0ABR2DGQ2_9ROSI